MWPLVDLCFQGVDGNSVASCHLGILRYIAISFLSSLLIANLFLIKKSTCIDENIVTIKFKYQSLSSLFRYLHFC